MRVACQLCVLFALALAVAPAEQHFEIVGELIPHPSSATVVLAGVDQPYQDQKVVRDGRFRFRGLAAGTYTILAAHPEWGETRRTLAVSESVADERGRVQTIIPVRRSSREHSRALEERSTVSVRELEIPDKAVAERKRAQAALERRNAEAAVEHLEKAVELAPDYADAWNDLGVLANQRKDFARAEEYFREALAAAPDEFAPLVNLGGVLLAQQKLPEAVRVNRQAVEARPEDALANAQLGLCYFYLQQEGWALKYLLEAKRLDPGHFTHPQAFLAEIHTRNGRYAAAIRELEDLAERYPDTNEGRRARLAADRLKQAKQQPGTHVRGSDALAPTATEPQASAWGHQSSRSPTLSPRRAASPALSSSTYREEALGP